MFACTRPLFFALFKLSLLAALMWPQWAAAHAEHDQARYVAENGTDTGRCEDKSAPCKTIAYAAKQAGKGDTILVAQGRYDITEVDSIFYLASSAVPVRGGLQKGSYAEAAGQHKSILVGVPAEFAEGLAQKGFRVISDTKGLAPAQQAYLTAKQEQLAAMQQAQAQTSCSNGKAGEFDCNKIDLLAHVPLRTLGNSNSNGNDIWGHVDLNDMREYALMGLTNGVSIVEVTDPRQPRMVSFIASETTIWRDIKTYQYFDANRRRWMSYAYVSADAANVGTLILDLNQLPQQVTVAASEKSDTSAHNIYISNVDYSTGVALTNRSAYLHLAGSDKQGGAFNSYSLANPLAPAAVYKNTANSRAFYSHDVASLLIDDERRSQCVDASQDCDLLLDYNENEILVWDKTNSAAPFNLARSSYEYVSYVHSGWWTEDKQFMSVHDELDEQRYGINTRVRFFSLNNLRAPELVGEYIGPTPAIDHNGFARGNRYYIANYERGLVVLDISNPRQPLEAGFFDSYPLANSAAFNGAWGTYPFLPSGTILLSDINSGLYLLQDNSAAAQGRVSFTATRVRVNEGELLRLTVARVDGSEGAVAVSYETQTGSAGDADFAAAQGQLEWLSGESGDKIIEIPIAADEPGNEFSETFFVRLFNPRNGLALQSPALLLVDISDKPDEPASSVAASVASSVPASSAANSANQSSGGGSVSLVVILLLMPSLYKLAHITKTRKKYGD